MVLIHRGVVAQAPLKGPAAVVVLHAKSQEVLELAVVAFGDDFYFDHPPGSDQDRAYLLGETEHIGRFVEVVKTLFQHVTSSPQTVPIMIHRETECVHPVTEEH